MVDQNHAWELREARASNGPEAELNWGIRGDLTLDDVSALPKGGRRWAELALWAASASKEELAARWAFLSRSKSQNQEELAVLIQLWVEKDLDGALKHVNGTSAEMGFLAAFAKLDPEQALSLAKERGEYFWGTTLATLAESDPGSALALLGECSASTRSQVVTGIAAGLMKIDPKQAMDFLKTSGVFGPDSSCMKEWALIDPEEAFQWAVENKSDTAYHAGDILMAKSPQAFAKRVEEMPTGRMKNEFRAKQARTKAQEDPDAAVRWAHEMPVGTRMEMLLAIGPELESSDVALRREILSSLIRGGVDPIYEGSSILDYGWPTQELERNPRAFIELAGEYNPGLLPSAAMHWAGRDGDGSYEWLSALPKNESFDKIAEPLVRSDWVVKELGYERAVSLVNKVSNVDSRQAMGNMILQKWNDQDPESFRRYLDSEDVLPEQLQWWEEQR